MTSEDQCFDVIVVGGGIMGSSTAYSTSKRGHSTLLLDQYDFLHSRGSSHGESRTFRLTYPEPYYLELLLESSSLWEQAQAEIGYRVLYPTTQLDMGPSHDPALKAVVKNNTGRVKVLDPPQVEEEFCGRVAVPQGWVGVVSGGAAVIKATKAVSMFQALALRNGAVLKDNMEVTSITRIHDHDQAQAQAQAQARILVCTATGDKFYGKKCVVTAGAWTNKLVKAVTGRNIPIQPLETTLCYWKIKEGHEQDYKVGNFPTFAGYGNPIVYGTPSLEYPGLIKVAIHGGRPFCDPEDRTWVPQPDLMESLKEWVRVRFGGLVEHEKPVLAQSCVYSMTPDEDFVIDFLGGEEFGKDVVVAGGFSGHGFKMGPAIGKVAADLVLHGDAQGVELDYFKLNRFDKNPSGNVKGFV